MRSPLPSFLYLVACIVLFARCGGSKPDETMSPEERFRLGMLEYGKKRYTEALQHFDVIRLQFPGSPVADSARFFSGMSRFASEEYLLASYEFSHLLQYNASHTLHADAQYMYARCFVELSPKSQLDQTYTFRAIDALQSFIENHPRDPRVAEAERTIRSLTEKLAKKEYETGLLYLKLENTRAAEVYFDNVFDKYYNTEYADDALAMKIRILMKRGKHAEAAPFIDLFLEKFPDSPYTGEVKGYRDFVTAHGFSADSRGQRR
ncbi:MAG: outer membrane protein assembly factor BamD [Bacteroidota bacterium]|nr:outer membrane protein assembly factor BamD [Bacteroidota bacterium]